MSKELEFLREDYKKTKKLVEANNRILKLLLENSLVKMYRDTYAQNEAKKKELEALEVSLTQQEMIECEHVFVRAEIQKEMDYDRIVKEPIYHCLKCGLTNAYSVKGVNPVLLSKIENNMEYIFDKTAKNGIILHERRTCPLDIAKEIYEKIQNGTKNLTITKEQLKTYFLVALSKSDPTYYCDLTYEIRKLAGFDIKDDPRILERIELRLRDVETVESGITCYQISDFSKDLFAFVMTIKKRSGVEFYSLEDISKYPELVSEELEKLSEKEREARFDMMAIPNPRAYVISKEKCEEFLNSRPNPEIRKRNREMVEAFRINNLTESAEPKKKTKKP